MNAPASQIESGLEIRASALESNSNDSHIARARIVSFVTVIVGILLAANWFVCQTWNRFWEAPSMSLWQIIPWMLSISFVVTTLRGLRHTNVHRVLVNLRSLDALWLAR